MASDKVQVIQDWPEPQKIKDIQSFLGFSNFYWHFILKYSEITIPLTLLTHKGAAWDFSKKCHSTFTSLKQAFTTTPILAHWIPGTPLIVETDTSDYTLAAILSTISLTNGEIHLIAFHSRTFTPPKLNYDVHDKELLVIFEAFKTWCHYLEGSLTPVDVITDHKNLESFSTTKLLTCWQVQWSQFLCQFNLIIRFHSRHLSTKPNALTRRWDVYPKEGGSDYTTINLTNLRPMFMQEQLASSLWATFLSISVLCVTIIMDPERLHSNIQSSLQSNPITSVQLNSPSPCWSVNSKGLFLFNEKIYVPDHSDLRLCILQYKHDHLISRYFRQNQTLELVQQYIWLKLWDSVKSYVKSCTTCMHSKSQRHRPYGLLKQLPIPERPWNSISMDFIKNLPMSNGSDMILVIIDHL